MEENLPRPPYLKIFLISSPVGAIFGIIIVTALSFFWDTTWPLNYYLLIVLFPALVSGGGGVLGSFLEVTLQQKGWGDEGLRRGVGFLVVSLLGLVLGLTALAIWGRPLMDEAVFRNAVIIVFGGIFFGGAIALFDYRRWKVRRRMMELEVENRFLGELAHRDQLLQEATRNLIVAEERNRMARELHDSISQGVHGIVYGIQSLREQPGNVGQREKEILDHLEATSEATLQELQELIGELKPSLLEDQGLEEALRLYGDLFARRQGVDLKIEIDYRGGLSPEQEVALYRIVQEALSNIGRHARAKRAELSLRKEGGVFLLEVSDDGKGFAPETVSRGQGLDNMATRARQANGWLEVNSRPGEGTTVKVELTGYIK